MNRYQKDFLQKFLPIYLLVVFALVLLVSGLSGLVEAV